jgi:alcohol dehydrogenase class IV
MNGMMFLISLHPPLAGMDESHIAEAVDKAHASSSMKGNSIVLSKDELTDILRKAL